MPSIAAHFTCAKLVAELLNINCDDFYKGNILPDVIGSENSHYTMQGKYYLIPNIKKFIENNDMKNTLNLGYLCHLLLDKYFLEEYIPYKVKDYNKINIFTSNLIYNDYTGLNKLLIDKFNLDIKYINRIMKDFNVPINKLKYTENIKYINNLSNNNELVLLNPNDFYIFLKNVSKNIAHEISTLSPTISE